MTATQKLKVRIATPLSLIDEIQGVDECSIPTSSGEVGVLPGHVSFMTELGTGILRYNIGNTTSFFVVSGGLLEVHENEVTVLADVGESGMSIDLKRAKGSLERARQRVTGIADGGEGSVVDIHRALMAEKRAQARIDAALVSQTTRREAGGQ